MSSPFCTDLDLLHWEPNLLKDASFASQTLLSAVGDLEGTTLTLAEGLIAGAGLSGGEVAYVGGAIDGCFPVVSIDSPTQLTLSVLYDKLFDDPASPVRTGPTVTGVPVTVRSFWAQRKVVSDLLLHLLGLSPDNPQAVTNPEALRRPCALGTLQMICSALSAVSEHAAAYAVRADLYERLYRRALRNARVELDLNADGQPDCRRHLAVLALVRD